MQPTQSLHPTHAKHRRQLKQPIVIAQPAMRALKAVPALPATRALNAVPALPATAELNAVPALPVTAALKAVPALPETAVLRNSWRSSMSRRYTG